MKLVKLMGLTDSEVDDIVRYTSTFIFDGRDGIMLESDWEDLVELFPEVKVENVTI